MATVRPDIILCRLSPVSVTSRRPSSSNAVASSRLRAVAATVVNRRLVEWSRLLTCLSVEVMPVPCDKFLRTSMPFRLTASMVPLALRRTSRTTSETLLAVL